MEKNVCVSGKAAVARPSVCVWVLLLLEGSNAEGPVMQCRAVGYVNQM